MILSISTDKFIAEFDAVLDTKHSGVRQALTAVKELLIFFFHFPFEASTDAAVALDYPGFLRALASHAVINPLFQTELSSLRDATRRGHESCKVGNDPPKTASDLRRLFFRSLASPLPQSEEITSRTRLPVFQWVSHDHGQSASGQAVNIELRAFELEDERTLELQDILAMSRTRLINTRLMAAFTRDEFRDAMGKLPVFKHDLRQLGIRKEKLAAFVSLLSLIDPEEPGFQKVARGESFDTRSSHWEKILADTNEYIDYEQFDKLLKTNLPHYYFQLSKLTGLLMVERSADGGYAGGTNPEEYADYMQYELRMLTASQGIQGRQLLNNFFLDAVDVVTPLWRCHKCWELGVVSEEILGTEFVLC